MTVEAVYLIGSLATGDYQPATSDIDLVAVTAPGLRSQHADDLQRLHRTFDTRPETPRLGCTYLTRTAATDPARAHPTWSHGQWFHRPLSRIARAELTRHAEVLVGPPPSALIPAVADDELRQAVSEELTGYWSWALRRPWLWWTDDQVDLAVLTMARARAAWAEQTLVSKSTALARLDYANVPDRLVAEVRDRRAGRAVRAGPTWRLRRGWLAHAFTRACVRELSGT